MIINKLGRQKDIIKVIQQLDITAAMYKNAVEKYKGIATYLKENGIEADMYPQGSFALGTVVRPVAKNPDAAYDLDFICQIQGSRENLSPDELWEKLTKLLEKGDLFGGKLEIYDKCLTVRYEDLQGFEFSIDIVPATDESEKNKELLRALSPHPELIDTAIAIPTKDGDWVTNNPKGYREWFEGINEPFLVYSQLQEAEQLKKQYMVHNATIEPIPRELHRSSVQRVVQILKYHRAVFFAKMENGDDVKPNSAIISTLVAKIAETTESNISVFDLLSLVTGELAVYAQQQVLSEADFTQTYGVKKLITRKNREWHIDNPANPKDNLADEWNTNPDIPRYFFIWASSVQKDLIASLDADDARFRAILEGAFGRTAVTKAWGTKYCDLQPRTIDSTTAPKPWRSK